MSEPEKQTKDSAYWRVFVALEDVRSAHNVGSIFRTADAAGAAGLYLIGTTPTPIDRFGRSQPAIAKTALGAERTMPWMYFEHKNGFLEATRNEALAIVAVEQDPRAVGYRQVMRTGDIVLVFGNEVDGISPELLAVADQVVSIPMYGTKESLNVSVVAGILLYQLLD